MNWTQCKYGHYTQSSELCSADVLDVWETSPPVCLGGLPDEQLLFPKEVLWNCHRQAFNSSGVADLIGWNEKKSNVSFHTWGFHYMGRLNFPLYWRGFCLILQKIESSGDQKRWCTARNLSIRIQKLNESKEFRLPALDSWLNWVNCREKEKLQL